MGSKISAAGVNTIYILTLNVGSSSIKFDLFEVGTTPKRILEGSIEKIGQAEAVFITNDSGEAGSSRQTIRAPDHEAAAVVLTEWSKQRIDPAKLSAIGHRIVHGGPKYSQPQVITPEVIEELRGLTPFDPEHLPVEIHLVESFGQLYPSVPQVACFDTAFHHDLPREALLLPIPRRYEAQGIRRYGFHGLSYTSLMKELGQVGTPAAAQGRVILMHLGNGASLAAVRGGKSIDTSMALTPAAGIPMSTRSGDIDPGLPLYLERGEGLTTDKFNQMVNFQSGLLGLSETTSDMEELIKQEANDVRAAEAVSLFCYQAKKWVGSFAAALGGLDTLVFSGGMGENAPKIRARICQDLEFFGIKLEETRNAANAGLISADDSQVAVRVIHADEAATIADEILKMGIIK